MLISALTGQGIGELLGRIARALPVTSRRMKLLLPFSQGALLAEIRARGKVFSEEFTEDGILTDALVDQRLWRQAAPFAI